MYVLMEMKYLADFPADVYDTTSALPVVKTEAAYHYDQLGIEPTSQMCFLNIRGDTDTFKTAFTGKYTDVTTIPSNYIQTCCNEFIYGRTLTKATIVAWKYPLDVENKINRQYVFLVQALATAESSRTTTQIDIINKQAKILAVYALYNEFVESVP